MKHMDLRTPKDACGKQTWHFYLLPPTLCTLLCIKLQDKRSTDIEIGKLSFVINIISHTGPEEGRK